MKPSSPARCNPWGSPIRPPRTRSERIAAVRRLAATLGESRDADAQWLADRLRAWMHGEGSTLEEALGIAPERGSTLSVPRLVQLERRDRLLVQFAERVGNDARALAILRGGLCPVRLAERAEELRRLRVPTSGDAVTRARLRIGSPLKCGRSSCVPLTIDEDETA